MSKSKKKSNRNKEKTPEANIKKTFTILGIAALLVAVCLFFRFTYTCDNCGKFKFGMGYVPYVLNEDEDKICRACALREHSAAITYGQKVEEFRYPLFNTSTEKDDDDDVSLSVVEN